MTMFLWPVLSNNASARLHKMVFCALLGLSLSFMSVNVKAWHPQWWRTHADIPTGCVSYCVAAFDNTKPLQVSPSGYGDIYLRTPFTCIACLASVTGKEDDSQAEADYFQDLKNFLAYQHLEDSKKDAKLRSTQPPFMNDTVLYGYNGSSEFSDILFDNYEAAFPSLYARNFLGKDEDDPFLSPGYAPVRKHLNDYCSQYEIVNPGISNPTAVSDLWGLCESDSPVSKPVDLLASTLLQTTQFNGTQDSKAALRYIENVTNFYPLTLLPKNKMFTNYSNKIMTDDGYKLLFDMYRQQSLLSLAQTSFMKMYTDRYPHSMYDPSTASTQETQKSLLAILDNESKRRFNNPEWYSKMNGTLSTQALIREINNIMAYRLAVNYRRVQQLERIEALLAAQTSFLASSMSDEARARVSASEATQ